MSIRVILADDHKLVRKGLKELVDQQIGIEVVGEANNGQAAVKLAGKEMPDVLVMDIGMPDMNGIEATRELAKMHPEIAVLALSMHADRQSVAEMFRAGARGYVVKDAAVDELARAIQTISQGQTYVSPEVAGEMVDAHICHQTDEERGSAYSLLTDREREVLQMLAEGNTTKEIAAKIYRSAKTVETHRRKIMQKLNLHSVAELTKYAIRNGLTELE